MIIIYSCIFFFLKGGLIKRDNGVISQRDNGGSNKKRRSNNYGGITYVHAVHGDWRPGVVLISVAFGLANHPSFHARIRRIWNWHIWVLQICNADVLYVVHLHQPQHRPPKHHHHRSCLAWRTWISHIPVYHNRELLGGLPSPPPGIPWMSHMAKGWLFR